MAEAPNTRKVQITVPAADTSVTEWLDLQFSASESIRRLIREAVAREGFVDVANRPVRPPAAPVIVEEMLPDQAPEAPASKPRRSAPKAAPAAAETDAEPAPPPTTARTRRERAAPSTASATIDDLLGL